MCNNVTTIKFCTCSKKKKISTEFPDEIQMWYDIKNMEAQEALHKGTYEKTYFKWTLQSFKKDKSRYVMGVMIYPVGMLAEKITYKSILELLNNNSCFDFTYTPKKNDYFKISEKYEYVKLEGHERPYIDDFMSFIYKGDTWIFGRHPIGYTFKDIKKGKIKIKKK